MTDTLSPNDADKLYYSKSKEISPEDADKLYHYSSNNTPPPADPVIDNIEPEVKQPDRTLSDRFLGATNWVKPFGDEVVKDVEALPKGINSLSRGLNNGASAGFNDEIMGAVQAVPKTLWDYGKYYLANGGKPEGLIESYKKYRNEERYYDNQANIDNPLTYGAGQLAGSTILPGKNIPSLAGVGAAQAIGNSTQELTNPTEGNVTDLLQDASLGAAGGAVAGTAGHYLGKAGSGLLKKAEQYAVNATRVAPNVAAKLPENAGRQLLDQGVVKLTSTPGDIASKSKSLMTQAGQKEGEILQEADKSTLGYIQDHIDNLNNKIAELDRVPGRQAQINYLKKQVADLEYRSNFHNGKNQAAVNALQNQINQYPVNPNPTQVKEISNLQNQINHINNTYGNQNMRTTISPSENNLAKRNYADQINFDQNNKQVNEGIKNVRNSFQQAEDDAADFIGKGQEFKDVKDQYGLMKQINKASSKADFANKQKSMLDFGDLMGMSAGGGIGNAIGSIDGIGHSAITSLAGATIVPALKRFVAPRAPAMLASSSDKIGYILKNSPNLLGKFAVPLTNALQRGPDSLSATQFILQQSNPEYRKMVDELNKDQENSESLSDEDRQDNY